MADPIPGAYTDPQMPGAVTDPMLPGALTDAGTNALHGARRGSHIAPVNALRRSSAVVNGMRGNQKFGGNKWG